MLRNVRRIFSWKHGKKKQTLLVSALIPYFCVTFCNFNNLPSFGIETNMQGLIIIEVEVLHNILGM